MSANVDLVRSIYADWERGDFSSVKWAHPEIEYVLADGPAPGVWKGVARMAEGFREFLGAWSELRFAVQEGREIDNERILPLHSYRSGRGKMSGLDVGQLATRMPVVFQVHSGQVTKLVTYLDGDRALADLDLGLKGQSVCSA